MSRSLRIDCLTLSPWPVVGVGCLAGTRDPFNATGDSEAPKQALAEAGEQTLDMGRGPLDDGPMESEVIPS